MWRRGHHRLRGAGRLGLGAKRRRDRHRQSIPGRRRFVVDGPHTAQPPGAACRGSRSKQGDAYYRMLYGANALVDRRACPSTAPRSVTSGEERDDHRFLLRVNMRRIAFAMRGSNQEPGRAPWLLAADAPPSRTSLGFRAAACSGRWGSARASSPARSGGRAGLGRGLIRLPPSEGGRGRGAGGTSSGRRVRRSRR
jgi:hypothetical protein